MGVRRACMLGPGALNGSTVTVAITVHLTRSLILSNALYILKIEEFLSSVRVSRGAEPRYMSQDLQNYLHASSSLTDQIDPMRQAPGVLRSSLPANGVTATAVDVWDGSSGAALSLQKSSSDPTGPPNRRENPGFP